mmetsp:Transcript_39743/g.51260  ORF Transcript_39743/g.51260 Transcript_39743/m.51260 type:complete len:1026 (+) Transcript_39743:252-3329(+)
MIYNNIMAQASISCSPMILFRCFTGNYNKEKSSLEKLSSLVKLCKKGYTYRALKKIEKFNININQRTNVGETALTVSAFAGHIDLAESLINSAHADVNFTESDGSSALHFACQKGWINLVKLLLSHKADPNLQRHDGCTPLMLAVENGFIDCVLALTENVAELPAETAKNGPKSPPSFGFSKKDLRRSSSGPASPTEVNVRRRVGGGTALHDAVQGGFLEIVTHLVHSCNANTKIPNHHGLQPIHLCCRKGLIEEAELLIKAGVEVSARDAAGFNCLAHAACRGHLSMVKLLLDYYPAGANEAGWNGNTPMHLACFNGQIQVIQRLLEEKDAHLLLEQRNWYGLTPLHLGVLSRNPMALSLLLNEDANLFLQSTVVGTPLHLAIAEGSEDLAQQLIETDPNLLSLQNSFGVSCVEMAFAQNMTDIVENSKFAHADMRQILVDTHLSHKSKQHKFMQSLLEMEMSTDLSLKSVLLVPASKVLEFGKLPSYNVCQANEWHVSAERVLSYGQASVLFVSHRWEGDNEPDESGRHFTMLEQFLQDVPCGWLWIDYSCVFPLKHTEYWEKHINHVFLALWCCTNFLILPSHEDVKEEQLRLESRVGTDLNQMDQSHSTISTTPRTPLTPKKTNNLEPAIYAGAGNSPIYVKSPSHNGSATPSHAHSKTSLSGSKKGKVRREVYQGDHIWATDLQNYLERAWCLTELMIAILQEDVQIHCGYQCGPLIAFEPLGRLEGCGSFLGFTNATMKFWSFMMREEIFDFTSLEQQRLVELWSVVEPVGLMLRLQKVLQGMETEHEEVFRRASQSVLMSKKEEATSKSQKKKAKPEKSTKGKVSESFDEHPPRFTSSYRLPPRFDSSKNKGSDAGKGTESTRHFWDLIQEDVALFTGDMDTLFDQLGETSFVEDKVFAFRHLLVAAAYAENLRVATGSPSIASKELLEAEKKGSHFLSSTLTTFEKKTSGRLPEFQIKIIQGMVSFKVPKGQQIPGDEDINTEDDSTLPTSSLKKKWSIEESLLYENDGSKNGCKQS